MVWGLHVDGNAWPNWQTGITASHLKDALERGVSFDWTRLTFSVTSTATDAAKRARVLWRGTAERIGGARVVSQRETRGVPVVKERACRPSGPPQGTRRPVPDTGKVPCPTHDGRTTPAGSLLGVSDRWRIVGRGR